MMDVSKIKESYKNCKEIKPDILLLLCELGEDYKLLCNDIEEFVTEKGNNARILYMTIVDSLLGVSLFTIKESKEKNNHKYKHFINKHKNILKKIAFSNLLEALTVDGYDEKGKRKENLTYDYFYQYLYDHKEDVEDIKALVQKIKNLGVEKIIFGEDIDFTKNKYEFNALYINKSIAFLENMEADPTYLNCPIKYHTNGSSYCLFLEATNIIDMRRSSIALNNLTINPDRLPNEITMETIVGVIQELWDKKKAEYTAIQNSIDLGVSTNNLEEQFKTLKMTAEKFGSITDKQELMNILLEMQKIINELQQFGSNFEKKAIRSYPDITAKKMARERKLCINRIELSKKDSN